MKVKKKPKDSKSANMSSKKHPVKLLILLTDTRKIKYKNNNKKKNDCKS